MGDKPVLTEVKKFDKGQLKHTRPQVKQALPTKADIEQEKKEQGSKS